jgi:hypothetical protein
MIYIQPKIPHPLTVRAVFKDGINAFELNEGATLVKLAEFLSDLEIRHESSATSIQVQFGRERPVTPH